MHPALFVFFEFTVQSSESFILSHAALEGRRMGRGGAAAGLAAPRAAAGAAPRLGLGLARQNQGIAGWERIVH